MTCDGTGTNVNKSYVRKKVDREMPGHPFKSLTKHTKRIYLLVKTSQDTFEFCIQIA